RDHETWPAREPDRPVCGRADSLLRALSLVAFQGVRFHPGPLVLHPAPAPPGFARPRRARGASAVAAAAGGESTARREAGRARLAAQVLLRAADDQLVPRACR